MALRSVALVAAVALLGFASPVLADDAAPEESARADWTGRSARPLARQDGTVALFGESRFGVGHEVQLGTHVMGLVAPHASVLWRFARHRRIDLASRLGLAYPTPMLALFTGEGTGALLPGDTKPPQTLMLDAGLRLSVALARAELVTFEAALVVAPRFTRTGSPVLDFPFLYPRLAAIDAPAVARLGATFEGIVAGPFRWVLSAEQWFLPVVPRGFAFEPRAGLAWASRRRVTLELGGRGSLARYPVGVRWHATPYADLRVSW